MKKITTFTFFLTLGFLQAQNINFDKLIGNNDPTHYYIGHYPVPGNDGLQIKWNGGIRFSTYDTTYLQIATSGNIGIGTENPQAKLDINGNLRINNASDHTFVSLGKELNDQIITDNTTAKHYGGGYFFRVHNENIAGKYIDALKISDNGNVAIANKLEAREVKVTTTPTADFVFEEDYNLPTLEEVEKHIKEKKHLPEIASAKEMEEKGVSIGEFQIKLLQKIEELTLYSIEQNKKIQTLQSENKDLKSLLKRVEKLEKSTKN